MPENTNIEYKELNRTDGSVPDSVIKEVVAFLNTDGGEIYVGIRDDGSVEGVSDPDDTTNRLTAMIVSSVKPDPVSFVRIDPVRMDGAVVVKCIVSPGTERPYFAAQKGLTPGGVFVRVGASSRNVSESVIRKMIVESSGQSYEEMRSFEQQLTFETLKEEMEKRGISFGEVQMRTLKMLGSDGLYTNLALLLSDQCPFVIKAAIFDGEIFRDREQFEGSLLKQLKDVYRYLCLNNKTLATFHYLDRVDDMDYPPDALREALLNSIVHRNYSFSGGNIINIRDDRIEFVSLGGLAPGISYEAIFIGVSESRNPNLAAVFYRLKLIESYGTGIRKILDRYEGTGLSPKFDTAEGVFRVTLPNLNYGRVEQMREASVLREASGTILPRKSREQMKRQKRGGLPSVELLRKFADEQGEFSRKDAERMLGVGTTRAFDLLKELCTEGTLIQEKRGRSTVYRKKRG